MEKILSIVLLHRPLCNKLNSEFPSYSKITIYKIWFRQNFSETLLGDFYRNEKMYILFLPAVPFLEIRPTDLLTHMPMTDTPRVFPAALLVMAKGWKSSKCLLLGEWLKKLLYPYSGIQGNGKTELALYVPM